MSADKSKETIKIKCKDCDREFTQKKNLYAHIRKFHDEEPLDKSNTIECCICFTRFASYYHMQNHFQCNHPEINLNFENKSFDNRESFDIWKESLERETVSSFVQRNGKKLTDQSIVQYYVCHRSGKIREVTDKKRHSKALGSNKIGSNCPATMKVTTHSSNGKVSVELQSVHVGHEQEAARLPLTSNERKLLAIQMEQGIPKSRVLDSIRTNFQPSTRFSITDRKDLHNICRDFKLDSNVCLDKDDAISVHLKVQKMLKEPGNHILLYKPVGEVSVMPGIYDEDFILGIMSNAQQKLLELHDGIVMIDSTHGLNQYKFKFTTLMVNDSNREGFPVAVFYSSRETADVMQFFFQAIKARLPDDFRLPSVFMSDDAPAYYNAWVKVFGEVKYHLLCSWHVKRAWKKNLNLKIKVPDLRREVKADLFELQEETDLVTFEHLCKSFFEKYSSNDNVECFLAYFKDEYMNRVEQWAYCHRIDCQINVNMKLERWHRLLKHEEGAGRVVKRLDKSLSMVLTAIRSKLLGRLISLERHKVTARVLDIRDRHDKIRGMASKYSVIALEDAGSWVVTKPHDNLIVTYEVSRKDVACDCPLRCDLCDICVHQFKCSCIDHCIRFNMCKHIHFVRAQFPAAPSILSDPTIAPSRLEEHSAISAEFQADSAMSSDKMKDQLLESLDEVKDFIINAKSEQELNVVKSCFHELKIKLALLSDNNSPTQLPQSNEPANKLIQKQVRF